MRRREFIKLVGGATALWPLSARAQQPDPMRRIGVLMGVENDAEGQARIAAFRQGLTDLGWTEGRNLRIEYRWAGGDVDRIRAYASELTELAPELLVGNGTPVLAALSQATRSIPILFVIVNDPVGQGFIASLAHRGGNITRFTFLDYSTLGKLLELLKQAAPAVVRVAVMYNPETNPFYTGFLHSFTAAPRALGVAMREAVVRTEADIEAAVATFAEAPDGGLLVAPDSFTVVHRGLIMRMAMRHRVPAIFGYRQFVAEGALMAYGPDTKDIFRRSASYVDRILKGAKPADLPTQAPTKFEFGINRKTAGALGLTVPATLLALADEVIE
jgi:putative tryptophan/tyrosine transport system substrate-binding protein